MKIILLFLTTIIVSTFSAYGQNPLADADRLFDAGKYEDAKRQYMLHKMNSNDQIAYTDQRIEHCDQCTQLLAIAEYLFSKEEYADAKGNYDKILAINPNDPVVKSRLSQMPAIASGPVTLFGYLQVYPGDLGQFASEPATVIANLNRQGVHGYDEWRIPTAEELALMKTSSSQIGLSAGNYMTSDGTSSGIVRLVASGKSIAEKEAEQKRVEEEQKKIEEEIRKTAEAQRNTGVLINGVWWAVSNVGSRGTFVANPEDCGEYYTFDEAQSACPPGWRLPTQEEFVRLDNSGSIWTVINGIHGRLFGCGTDAFQIGYMEGITGSQSGIFLPAAGFWSFNNGTLTNAGGVGNYWSAMTPSTAYSRYLGFGSVGVNPSCNSLGRTFGLAVRCVIE